MVMRVLLDGYYVEFWDFFMDLMLSSDLFVSKRVGGWVFVILNFNIIMEEYWDKILECILFFWSKGVFKGWLMDFFVEDVLKWVVFFEMFGIFDYLLVIKLGVYIYLWGGVIQYLGIKCYYDKWLVDMEVYYVCGCFVMIEFGYGSNVSFWDIFLVLINCYLFLQIFFFFFI